MSYNYMDDGYIAYQPNFVESGMNAAHMTMSHFEMFEGNLTFALSSDATWGGTTFITWLRNVAMAQVNQMATRTQRALLGMISPTRVPLPTPASTKRVARSCVVESSSR